MKLRIINQNYVHTAGNFGRLRPADFTDDNPWLTLGCGEYKRHATHAEAIRYVDEMTTTLREVP